MLANLYDEISIDFFAVSLPDFLVFEADLEAKHELHCRLMMALGYLGLQKDQLADEQFARILRLDGNHLGALTHRGFVQAEARPVI